MIFTSETTPAQKPTAVRLPPLILHPFADTDSQSKLVESSRAGMMLEGLLPEAGKTRRELDRALLEGRYCELRMLFYVGKDLARWIEQCMEIAERQPDAFPAAVSRQSFAAYLIEGAPPNVTGKLDRWGVKGYQRIFARALALHSIFNAAPEPGWLTDEFIRNHHRYADQIFAVDQHCTFPALPAAEYAFELYASGEYSRLLEREWDA